MCPHQAPRQRGLTGPGKWRAASAELGPHSRSKALTCRAQKSSADHHVCTAAPTTPGRGTGRSECTSALGPAGWTLRPGAHPEDLARGQGVPKGCPGATRESDPGGAAWLPALGQLRSPGASTQWATKVAQSGGEWLPGAALCKAQTWVLPRPCHCPARAVSL